MRLFLYYKLLHKCSNDIIFASSFQDIVQKIFNAGIAQLVERNLAKVEVAGSSPVSRSKIHSKWILFYIFGAVPKWLKGKVCKTFIRRFESDRRLTFLTIHFIMYYVYILLSNKDNKRYIGMTSDIQRRLFEHNSGLVKSTKHRRPLELIHHFQFDNKSDALVFEKKLKSKKGKITFRELN